MQRQPSNDGGGAPQFIKENLLQNETNAYIKMMNSMVDFITATTAMMEHMRKVPPHNCECFMQQQKDQQVPSGCDAPYTCQHGSKCQTKKCQICHPTNLPMDRPTGQPTCHPAAGGGGGSSAPIPTISVDMYTPDRVAEEQAAAAEPEEPSPPLQPELLMPRPTISRASQPRLPSVNDDCLCEDAGKKAAPGPTRPRRAPPATAPNLGVPDDNSCDCDPCDCDPPERQFEDRLLSFERLLRNLIHQAGILSKSLPNNRGSGPDPNAAAIYQQIMKPQTAPEPSPEPPAMIHFQSISMRAPPQYMNSTPMDQSLCPPLNFGSISNVNSRNQFNGGPSYVSSFTSSTSNNNGIVMAPRAEYVSRFSNPSSNQMSRYASGTRSQPQPEYMSSNTNCGSSEMSRYNRGGTQSLAPPEYMSTFGGNSGSSSKMMSIYSEGMRTHRYGNEPIDVVASFKEDVSGRERRCGMTRADQAARVEALRQTGLRRKRSKYKDMQYVSTFTGTSRPGTAYPSSRE